MLVFNAKEKTWTCENPSEEEVKELLEMGKRGILQGFSNAFVANLLSAEAQEQAGEIDEEVDNVKPFPTRDFGSNKIN